MSRGGESCLGCSPGLRPTPGWMHRTALGSGVLVVTRPPGWCLFGRTGLVCLGFQRYGLDRGGHHITRHGPRRAFSAGPLREGLLGHFFAAQVAA